jgi:hypothetical protein
VSTAPGDQWSFRRIDHKGRVVEVAEKMRISNCASTGLYYFTSGRQLVEVSEQIIHRYYLDEINEAVEVVRKGEAGRRIVSMT